MSWPSWPTVEPKFTHGELVQIVLTVATVSTGIWLWFWRGRKRRNPLWIRSRDANGRAHRSVRLTVGTSSIRLVLSSHVPRDSGYYQFEVMERSRWWRPWVLSQTPAVLMSAVGVHPTGARGAAAIYSGPPKAQLNLPADYQFHCTAKVQAIIYLDLIASAPWKGAIRVEVGGLGEEGARAMIPVLVS